MIFHETLYTQLTTKVRVRRPKVFLGLRIFKCQRGNEVLHQTQTNKFQIVNRLTREAYFKQE